MDREADDDWDPRLRLLHPLLPTLVPQMTLPSPLAAVRITSSIAPTIRSGVWQEMEVFARRDRQMTGNLRLAGYQRGICEISDSIHCLGQRIMGQPYSYSPVKRKSKIRAAMWCTTAIPITRQGTDSLSLTRELTPGLFLSLDPGDCSSHVLLFCVHETGVQQEQTSDITYCNSSWM